MESLSVYGGYFSWYIDLTPIVKLKVMLRLFVSFFFTLVIYNSTGKISYSQVNKLHLGVDNTVKTGSNSEIKDVSIYKRIQPKI